MRMFRIHVAADEGVAPLVKSGGPA